MFAAANISRLSRVGVSTSSSSTAGLRTTELKLSSLSSPLLCMYGVTALENAVRAVTGLRALELLLAGRGGSGVAK